MKYDLSRFITIDAPLSTVWPHISHFHKWATWSPWTVMELSHKSTISGTDGQKGAKMEWDGEIIGSGEMIVTDMTDHSINYALEFFKPFKSKATSSFSLAEVEGKTTVTWTMQSSVPFFLFFLVKAMKSWIEMDYDRGLAMLKSVVETGGVPATTTNAGVVDMEGFSYIGRKRTSQMQDMPTEMSAEFENIMNALKTHNAEAKKWITLYSKMDMARKEFTYISAVSDEQLQGKQMGDGYVSGEIKSGKMLKITHKGSYQFLGNAWSMGMVSLRARKMKPAGDPFELYHNSPMDTPEEELLTDIYFPVKG